MEPEEQLSEFRHGTQARAMTALLTLDADNLTLTDLAAVFRREPSTLSQAAGRLQKRLLEVCFEFP